MNDVRQLVAAGVAVLVSVVTLSAQTVSLDTLLARAGRYVGEFIARFSTVVAEERYVQDTLGSLSSFALGGRGTPIQSQPSRHRELKSDFLLVKSDDAIGWLPFRDVFEVDGTAIRDREQRLAKLFLQSSSTAI